MKLIDGKVISAHIKQQVKAQVDELKAKGTEPCLAVIIVGDDFASRTYVNNKKRTCEEVGIKSLEFALPAETTQDELLELVEKLNVDDSVNGILCQLPIPKHIDEKVILNAIKPEKDVDAFHPVNAGHIMIGDCVLKPCTPAGIMEMLKYEGVDVAGKNCVVIGRSNIVGKPMAMLLLAASGTVTVCHSRTQNLAEITKSADILVAAVGKAKFVTADMVKEGAFVVDVGINRGEDNKLCGDVHPDVANKADLTPVPRGVGLTTVASLMYNTVNIFKMNFNRKA